MAKKQSKNQDYQPDIKGAEKAYKKSQEDLLESGRTVERKAGQAAKGADFFAPERGRYIASLRNLMAGGASATAADPSYKWRFKQGQAALESSLAAQGLLNSGRAALELQQYGQQAASQEFQNQYQRLFELAGVGQSNPTAAANLMYQGALAPFQAQQSIAQQVFDSAQADKDRAGRMELQRMEHEFSLDRIRTESELRQREQARSRVYPTSGVSPDYKQQVGGRSYGSFGGGRTSDEGFLSGMVPVGETYKKNVRAGQQAEAESQMRYLAAESERAQKKLETKRGS